MRRLLANLFLHEYHLGSFFQKDYFLEDMASGRRWLCSSVLVNAVLAWASVSFVPHIYSQQLVHVTPSLATMRTQLGLSSGIRKI